MTTLVDRSAAPRADDANARCKACGRPSGVVVVRLPACYPRLVVESYDVHHCRGCGLLFVAPDPPDADLRSIYDRRVEPATSPDQAQRRAWVARWHWRPLLDEIAQRVGTGRLLDAGCGDGSFLDLAMARGFDARGFDRSETLVTQAARRHGARVVRGSVEALPYLNESFDAVRFCHVLEHQSRPLLVLRRLRDVLRPGGVLSLALPVVDPALSWLLRHALPSVLRAKLFKVIGRIFPPEHLTAWPTRVLQAALSQTGFVLETTTYRNDAEPWLRGSRRYFLLYRALGIPLAAVGSGVNIELLARRIDERERGPE